jgi:hypothetical protein
MSICVFRVRIGATYEVLHLEVRHGRESQVVHRIQVRLGNPLRIQDQVLRLQVQVLSDQPVDHVQPGAQHQVQPPASQQW